jgi:hypothetical protein
MKTQKQRGVKAPQTENTRVNLRLSTEASRRLFVTSVMAGETASSIVEGLILDGLKRFSLPMDLSKRQNTQSSNLPSPVQLQGEIAA